MDSNSQSSAGAGSEGSDTGFKEALLNCTKNAMKEITTQFQMANQGYAWGYAKGRQDAYEDVFKWFTDQHDNTFRYVSTRSFFNFINDKLLEVKSKYAHGTSLINSNILGSANDESMSDGISKLENLTSSATSEPLDTRSTIEPTSSSFIKKFGLREQVIMNNESRKRRRSPFNFGGTAQNSSTPDSELPPSLRPENNLGVTNPFANPAQISEPRITIPKRRKDHW